MRSFKLTAALSLALALCLLLSACGGSTPKYDPDKAVDPASVEDICYFATGLKTDETIATVDGEPVTAGELLYGIVSVVDSMYNYYAYHGLQEDPWDSDLAEGKDMRRYVVEDSLNVCASRVLLFSHAEQEGIVLTEEDLSGVESAVSYAVSMAEQDGKSLDAFLREYGLTEELYRMNVQCESYLDHLSRLYFADADAEAILNYLVNEKKLFRAAHILISTEDPDNDYESLGEADMEKKRIFAEGLLSRIRSSGDPQDTFLSLMARYTDDPGLESNPNGYLGTPGQFVEEFENAVLDLEVGEISDVVQSEYGFHIIMRLPLNVDPEEYRDDYNNASVSALLDKWVADAEIVTRPAYDKLDAEKIFDAVSAYRDAVDAAAEAAAAGGSYSSSASSSAD